MKYLTLGLLLLWAQMVAAQQPNILWISCEDIGPHLGCYGYAEADTPHLDALAAKGVRFTNAHTVTGVCATCRASMITGMFPSTLGNQFMRCKVDLPEHVKLFPQYLRDAGYYCTNNSKTDYNITDDAGTNQAAKRIFGIVRTQTNLSLRFSTSPIRMKAKCLVTRNRTI